MHWGVTSSTVLSTRTRRALPSRYALVPAPALFLEAPAPAWVAPRQRRALVAPTPDRQASSRSSRWVFLRLIVMPSQRSRCAAADIQTTDVAAPVHISSNAGRRHLLGRAIPFALAIYPKDCARPPLVHLRCGLEMRDRLPLRGGATILFTADPLDPRCPASCPSAAALAARPRPQAPGAASRPILPGRQTSRSRQLRWRSTSLRACGTASSPRPSAAIPRVLRTAGSLGRSASLAPSPQDTNALLVRDRLPLHLSVPARDRSLGLDKKGIRVK